jgi:hypothetical protein
MEDTDATRDWIWTTQAMDRQPQKFPQFFYPDKHQNTL